MAMTGSGSASDPYKPTNWDEFVTAITTGYAYVECPENEVWDMNEQKPTGVGQITPVATSIKGNGLIIKNLYCRSNQLFYNNFHYDWNTRDLNVYIYDLHFINMNLTSYFQRLDCSSREAYGARYFRYYGCTFTGISSGTDQTNEGGIFNVDSYNDGDGGYKAVLTFNVSPYSRLGCTFKIVAKNTPLFTTRRYGGIWSYFSYINYDGYRIHHGVENYGTAPWPWYENCLIEGDMSGAAIFENNVSLRAVRAKNTVFNINMKGVGPEGYADSANLFNVVLNVDKINDSKMFRPGFIYATTDQLQDAEYLRSKGFPIGIRNGS